MEFHEKIIDIIDRLGIDYTEKVRTIYTTCPSCQRSDKFSILKVNGSCVCYHGSCSFGQQWFEDWIALTARVTKSEAKKMFNDFGQDHSSDTIDVKLDSSNKLKVPELIEIQWPEGGYYELDDIMCQDGVSYLQGRGIPLEIAKHYDIRYAPLTRRIVFPLKIGNKCYGWQARAIDKVSAGDRFRFNSDYPRANTLMFINNVRNCKHIIVAEGPIDAMKFHLAGGNVATGGKEITSRQIELINKTGVDTLYLALDPDAAKEARDLASKVNMKVKVIELPQSCIERCKLVGKKADFGECTFEENLQAFKNAKDFDTGYILIYLK